VLVDAFVVRIMVLPSILTLLGDATWWPSRVRPTYGVVRTQTQPLSRPAVTDAEQ